MTIPTLMLWLLLPPTAVNQIGAEAFARGQFIAAQRLFALAWSGLPRANVASNLGATARRLGEWDAAERWFTTVIELRTASLGPAHADTAIAWNNRGEARMHQGRLTEARADLSHALAFTELSAADRAAVLHNLGDLNRRERQWTDAKQVLELSLALRPSATLTATLLATVLAEMGEVALDRARLGEAMRLCRQAVALAPAWGPARRCRERVQAVAVEVTR